MDQTRLNRLEEVLVHHGEVASAILIFIPLGLELYVRYGFTAGFLLLGAVGLTYGLLFYLRTLTALRKSLKTTLVITSYFLTFSIIVWLLTIPLSPIVFTGVIISAFVAFVFSLRGTLLIILVMNFVLLVSFLVHHRLQIDGPALAELVSTGCTLSLLIYFVTDLVKINQEEIDELNKTYQQLRAEHLRLVSLINTLGDAIIATDREGHIQIYNGAALELLNTNASLSGNQLDEMWQLVDADEKPVKLIEESARLNQNFRRSDLVIKYSESDRANLYVNVTPIKVGYGTNAERGFTFIVRDITKEKSLDEERDEFISVVSHELRTPVTITEGKISNAQLLMNKPRSPKGKISESLNAAHAQVVFLSNMINDLADLARAERDDASVELERVEPARLINDIVKSFEIEARQKNLSISSHLPKQSLPVLFTSRLYIQEILQNFVANALKYTKTGGVTVSARTVSGGEVEFMVEDTGIGISTSDLKRIFDKFFRSEDYRTRENSGTGLGLYVTMKLAKKINGHIEAKSQLNQGSVFSLRVGSLPEALAQRSRGAA